MKAMAVAYIRFAAEHPAYYEVMFSSADQSTEPTRTPSPSAARAFGILEETIRQGQEAGELLAEDSVMLARLVWAQVHGICMLRLAPDVSVIAPTHASSSSALRSCKRALRGIVELQASTMENKVIIEAKDSLADLIANSSMDCEGSTLPVSKV